MNPVAEFFDQVEPANVLNPDACWNWQGRRAPTGYGEFGRKGLAHRYAYTIFHGPIPENWVVGHTCANRACVNPNHLIAETRSENQRTTGAAQKNAARQRSKTHCAQGHEFTPENTYISPLRQHRKCRICRYVSHKKTVAKRRLK